MIMMIGGSIAGETKVLSVLIYDHTEAMNYDAAHQLSFFPVSTLCFTTIHSKSLAAG